MFGCKQYDIQRTSENKPKDLTIGEAKNHFEKNIRSSRQVNTSNLFEENKEPMWDASKYRELLKGNQAVLVPLHKENTYVTLGDYKVKVGFLNYMMMYKDSLDNVKTEWVQLVPTEN